LKKLILVLFLVIGSVNILFSQIWQEQVSGVTVQLTSASTISYFSGWICGYSGTVLKTTNIGQNWINVSGNGIPSTVSLINIYGIDQNNAITAGYTGTNTFVYRTTNAGSSWTQVFTQANGFIDAVWMTTTTSGFMVGDPVGARWSLWKTTNGGSTWDSTGLYLPQNGSEGGWNNSLYVQGQSIWFGTNNTRIYNSSNFGVNWNIQSTAPEVNSYSIYIGPSLAWTGGSILLKSTNTGINWTQISAPGTANFGGIIGQGPCVWYARNDNNIYFSNTGGTNWILQYTAPSGTYRNISYVRTPGSSSVWAVRNNGGISRTDLVEVGIHPVSGEIPEMFSLKQNFPNPFNPSTKIRFEIPSNQNNNKPKVLLGIYDILGREVAVLINEILSPGSYEVNWNASNYASGIYFYKIIASEFSQTNKMILMK